jgi:hypothetical protein
MQALGAALSLAEVTGVSVLTPPGAKRNITFSVPVVVVDGRLVEASLAADGEATRTEEVRQHCLHVQRPGVNAGGTMVFVVTKPALAKFVGLAAATADGLFGWCKENEAQFERWAEQLTALRVSTPGPTRHG